MIKSFKTAKTRSLFERTAPKGAPADVVMRAYKKLVLIHTATSIEDLRFPPGNRLHELLNDRAGQWSISVNDQWRICFVWKDGDAFDVEFVDYH